MKDEPPDCKYKNICNFYEDKTLWGEGCYEGKCWRALYIDGMLKEGILEELLKREDK